jgi:hypothetical protein
MNNKTLAACRPGPLACMRRLTGNYRMPLECVWVQADTAKMRLDSPASSSDETGGRNLCASGTRS